MSEGEGLKRLHVEESDGPNSKKPRLENETSPCEVHCSASEEVLIYADTVRFYPPGDLKYQAIAIDTDLVVNLTTQPLGSKPPSFGVVPVWTNITIPTVRIAVEVGTNFYGGGEQPSHLCLNGHSFRTWNTDAYMYNPATPSLYQSHPYCLAVRPNGSAFGVIADSTYPLRFDFTDTGVTITDDARVEHKGFSLTIIEKKSPQEVVRTLAELTGFIQLPPMWSLGYQQCRWSYYPQERALEVAKTFREKHIPCDVIWFDIHYMDGYRIFTFDPKTFPDPEGLNKSLHDLNFHTVWMIDPGVKKEKGYSLSDELVKLDLAVHNGPHDPEEASKQVSASTPKEEDPEFKKYFVGEVWPGDCLFPDFTMPETRDWWQAKYKDFLAKGIDGVWNDMNEPAVFGTISKTASREAVHRGFGGGIHERFHNVYGMLMAKASHQGMSNANPDKRPFLLTRANFLGGQKYAATWTGDNGSSWYHLGMSIPMCLNLGLSGQPFSGPDIGGFAGDATSELFARWIGIGAFLPFCRGHTHHESIAHEPYSFGKHTEDVARISLRRRYRLLPYYYTLFYEAATSGLPVVRPLFFADPADPKLRKEDRAFLVGDGLIVIADVHPDLDPESETEKYEKFFDQGEISLPTNKKWFDLILDDEVPSVKEGIASWLTEAAPVGATVTPRAPKVSRTNDLALLKISEGTIIPAQPPVEHTISGTRIPNLVLYIALNSDRRAHGLLYEDEGEGHGYKNGYFALTTIDAYLKENELFVTLEQTGTFNIGQEKISLVVIGNDNQRYQNVVVPAESKFTVKLEEIK